MLRPTERLRPALRGRKAETEQLKQEVASAATAYKSYKASLGEADSATIAAKANLDAVKVEYRESVAEVRKLEGQNVALKKSTQNAADAFSAAQTKLNGAKAAVKETGSEIDKTNAALELSRTQWDAAGQTIVQSGQAIASIGKQMQNAESRFRLAAAGIKDFDKSAEGLSAKLTCSMKSSFSEPVRRAVRTRAGRREGATRRRRRSTIPSESVRRRTLCRTRNQAL